MILNHLWGLYTHPHAKRESLIYTSSHILLVALIPALCCYFSTVYLGWPLNDAQWLKLSQWHGLIAALATYLLIVSAVFGLALGAWGLAIRFKATPTFTQTLELSAYAATPLIMFSLCALYPQPWLLMSGAVLALSYSSYLLHEGVSMIILIRVQQRQTYAITLIVCVLTLFATAAGIIGWLYRG